MRTNQPDRWRDYNGVEFALRKRYSDRWMADVSFAFNKAGDKWGSLAGVEDPTNLENLTGASFAPELPTVAEAGLPGYEATGWYAFMVPAGTPAGAIAKLHREITRILDMPATKERLVAMGADPWPTTPEKAQEYIASEVERWSKVVTKAGLKGSE